jgi:hypothetical protein
LPSETVSADGDQVVAAPGRSDDLRGGVFLFGDDPAVLTQANVATGLRASIVTRGAVGIEADQTGEAPLAAVHFLDDLLVVDAFEELASQRNAGAVTAFRELVEEAVGDELQPLLDQLVVNFPLALDLLRRLELRRESRLELAEAHVVQPCGVDVIAGDPTARRAADLDRTSDRPV